LYDKNGEMLKKIGGGRNPHAGESCKKLATQLSPDLAFKSKKPITAYEATSSNAAPLGQ
jgi:hypothetical protein